MGTFQGLVTWDIRGGDYIMHKELVSAIQEFLRTLIIGEIFVLMEILGIIYLGINQELGTFIIQWNVALAVFVAQTVLLVKVSLGSALDEYLHKQGIQTPLDLQSLDALKK